MLKNKYDFVAIISVANANPNGDPLNENRPRETSDGYGEISDVAIKRKIRNTLQEMGEKIFVQSNDNTYDGYKSLAQRAEKEIEEGKKLSQEEYVKKACEKFLDVRSFGQVFAYKEGKGSVSVSVRGPVSIHPAFTVDPIEIEEIQITKSVNSETKDNDGKGSDTMGMKYRTKFGLYILKGSITPQLAEKTGFDDEDAEKVHQAIIHMFDSDASAARPAGSVLIERVYWFKHESKNGKCSTVEAHRSIEVKLKQGVTEGKTFDDYQITQKSLEGVDVEIFPINA